VRLPIGLGFGLLSGVALALASAHAEAQGDEQKRKCVTAYEEAQRERKQGELVASLEKLRYCGSPACPRQMHADCGQWLREVEAALPTVVFSARSTRGESLTQASLSIDGSQPRRLDGRAQVVDPGEHEVSVASPGFEPLVKRMLFAEGEKLQEQVLTLEPISTSSAPAQLESRPQSAPARAVSGGAQAPTRRFDFFVPLVAASGLAVLGGTGFAYFGFSARAGDRALASCTPSCSRDQVDQVKRDYLFANLSLGAGIAGVLASATLLILSRSDAPKPSAAVRSTLLLGPTTVWTTTF
jgi:hypothetical protein